MVLDPNKVHEMVHAVSSAVSLPVTVKMRTGWDEDHLYAVDNALAPNKRRFGNCYAWSDTCPNVRRDSQLGRFKGSEKHLTIPFMGNGDVKTPEDAKRMLEYVGADGVMIGRAALGNPWMIQRTKEYLETGELMPEPSPAEKINIAKVHLQRLVDLKVKNCGP